MRYQNRIIRQIAMRESERIARSVIRALQKTTRCLLSGDDTVLKNMWDEICVQMQSQESFAWESYLEAIKAHVAFAVESLPRLEQEAIWLQTPQSVEWETEPDETPDSVPICLDDITEHILQDYVLCRACDYHNERIEKFLEQGHELD